MPSSRLSDRLLAPFRRKTSSGRYIAEVDGLRCLAVVLVVLFHSHHFFSAPGQPETIAAFRESDFATILTNLPNFLIGKGWFGVQIFFVISGMVLAVPFAAHYLKGEELPKLSIYLRRRLVRIEMPYLITLTFFLLFAVFFEGKAFSGEIPHYVAGVFYSHGLIYNSPNPLLFVAWTLELEIQFYLCIPLLCRLFSIGRAARWVSLIGATLAFDQCGRALPLGSLKDFFEHTFLAYFGYFAAGILLADLFFSEFFKSCREAGGRWGWDLVALVVWPLNFVILESHLPFSLSPFLLFVGFVAILLSRSIRRAFSNRWILAVGTMCYTVYLFHNLFLYGVLRPYLFGPIIPVQGGNWPFNYLLIGLMAFLAIVLCSLAFHIVEKPFARGRMPKFGRASRER